MARYAFRYILKKNILVNTDDDMVKAIEGQSGRSWQPGMRFYEFNLGGGGVFN